MGFNVPDWRILTIYSGQNALTMCVPVDEVERMLTLQVGQCAFDAVAVCCMLVLGVCFSRMGAHGMQTLVGVVGSMRVVQW